MHVSVASPASARTFTGYFASSKITVNSRCEKRSDKSRVTVVSCRIFINPTSGLLWFQWHMFTLSTCIHSYRFIRFTQAPFQTWYWHLSQVIRSQADSSEYRCERAKEIVNPESSHVLAPILVYDNVIAFDMYFVFSINQVIHCFKWVLFFCHCMFASVCLLYFSVFFVTASSLVCFCMFKFFFCIGARFEWIKLTWMLIPGLNRPYSWNSPYHFTILAILVCGLLNYIILQWDVIPLFSPLSVI